MTKVLLIVAAIAAQVACSVTSVGPQTPAGNAVTGRKVAGRVTGLPPSFLSAVRPRVILVSAGRPLDAPIGADGSFELINVPPGRYAARVNPLNPLQTIADTQIRVATRDVDDVRIALPPVKEINGRAIVTGGGTLGSLVFLVTADSGRLNRVSAGVRPDGTFTIILPQGRPRIALDTSGGAPAGYALKALNYGSLNLIEQPRTRIASRDSVELRVELAAVAGAWVSVRGRLAGLATGDRNLTVILSGADVPGQTTQVNADGSFEFQKVARGRYNLRVAAAGISVSKSIDVDQNLTGVEIVMPNRKQVAGHLAVEGGDGPMPRSYAFSLVGSDGQLIAVTMSPACNGSFTAVLPQGEHQVSPGLPGKYVKSFSYGATNLLQSALEVSPADSAELRITFAAGATTESGPIGSVVGGVRVGLVNGPPLPPQRGGGPALGQSVVSGCVVVEGQQDSRVPTFSVSFSGSSRVESPVSPDGTFQIQLRDGEYRLAASGLPPGYSVKSIAVGSRDLTRELLKITGQSFLGIVVVLEGVR